MSMYLVEKFKSLEHLSVISWQKWEFEIELPNLPTPNPRNIWL